MRNWIKRLKDGTVKQMNPFTGTEVWSVPERAGRPLMNLPAQEPRLITRREPEDYCSFCEGMHERTTPEKSRLVLEDGKYRLRMHVPPQEALKVPTEFRRIANMFEIVSYDYWQKNYDFGITPKKKKWKETYLADPAGERHIKDILEYKFRRQGRSEEWLGKHFWSNWRELADGLFGGSHDLVIARRHYIKKACFETDLASAGELSFEEHYQFLSFTLSGIQDIMANNPHVEYVSVFQNWLSQAGASFNHLHKQLVGLDEPGSIIAHMLKLVEKDPKFFNRYLNYCIEEGLVVAENKGALCAAMFGERYPTLAVFSKSKARFPWELEPAELRDFSELVHAVHFAMASELPCNEEWYFTPLHAKGCIPWHMLLKWRLNVPAGFEGNTEIYINTTEPWTLRDKVAALLEAAKAKKRIASVRIGSECRTERDPLS